MKQKPITPYARLLETCRRWANSARYPIRKPMFTYANASETDRSFTIADLYQRTAAADQLGYDVLVQCEGKNLVVTYRARVPELPWELR